jgi:hypothetical protein
MTRTLAEQNRTLLGAPLRVPNPVESLGSALFLYVAIVLAANEKGLAVRSRSHFARDLAVSEESIDAWIELLVHAKLIRVLSPSPYLAISLGFWSGSSVIEGQNPRQTSGKQALRDINARGSSKLQQHAAALSSNRDRGLGEGAPTNGEIREILGDPGLDVPALVRGVPAIAVRNALTRVRETPTARIRTSKTALFRYLLAKFSQELDVDEL